MNEVSAITLDSMLADKARVDQIAMNVANSLTPAYKRRIAVQRPSSGSFAAHLGGAAQVAAGTAPDATGDTARGAQISITPDLRPASLKATGLSLDVALAGPGYFEIATPEGPAYTRGGQFRRDASGRLVTAKGDPVMGSGGEITLPTDHPVITATGALIGPGGSEQSPLARLRIVTFDEGASLAPLGNGLYRAGAGMKPAAPQDVRVQQGFLESSNVSTTHEMTQLTLVMRHFESMQKFVQVYDDLQGNAIRKLGESA